MAWNIHSKATTEQTEKLAVAAVRFCKRHNIDTDIVQDAESAVSFAIENDRPRLKPLWRAICKRITGSADGIAYGYVGNSCN